MTLLSLAARNLLAQDDRFREWVARSQSWDIWIFDTKPVMAKFENNSKCLIVINEGDPWTSPNEHNTLEFPSLVVDIWADPDRRADKTILRDNAKDKIKAVARIVNDHLHRVDPGGPDGGYMIWGTAQEIDTKTGVLVSESKRLSGPVFSPIKDAEGAWMGRYTYGINQP
jgi:hypothetical protein